VYQQATASIADNFSIEDQIKVYPNPTSETLKVKIPVQLLDSQAILFSITGKKIKEFKLNSLEGSLSISELKKGVYFLNILNNKMSYSYKIIKI
jgi:hypothetical protein